MTRFNPFKHLDSKRGAPMGRRGDGVERYTGGKLYARHCGGDGYYDRGGAYWGHSRVYAVFTRGGAFCTYVEARGKVDAIKQVQVESGIFYNIAFYDAGESVVDRFTAVFKDRPERVVYEGCGKPQRLYEALAFNASPFHPLGYGQHCTAMFGRHLGKRIPFADLPEQAQNFVVQNI